jgi:hypothetical protein
MNPMQLLSQLRAGPQSPGALLSAMVPFLTAGARVKLAGVAELAEGADLIGPRPAPPAFARLFEEVGQRCGLPPVLLAAMAVTLSGMDPGYLDEGRAGLMGLPLELVPENGGTVDVTAEYLELVNLEPAAIAAVSLNVNAAASRLAELRAESPAKLAGALFRYCELGHSQRVPDERFARSRVDAGRIAGAAVLMGLRELDADFLAAASRAFGAGDDV